MERLAFALVAFAVAGTALALGGHLAAGGEAAALEAHRVAPAAAQPATPGMGSLVAMAGGAALLCGAVLLVAVRVR